MKKPDDPDNLSILFDRARMKFAREMRGITRVQLCQDVGSITPAAISQFENGQTRPSLKTINRMAVVLRVPSRFFCAPLRPQDSTDPVAFFRSIRSTSPRDRLQALAYTRLARELADALDPHVVLPAVDVPRLPLDPAQTGPDQIERTACRVRADWGIGTGPVRDVTRLLESKGVTVIRCPLGIRKMWAFAVDFPDRPVIFADPAQTCRDRDRLDLTHELGHLVMHQGVDKPADKTAENEAEQFAAAFLMPADGIKDVLPTTLDWPRLLQLKTEWGVPIAALLTRAKTLGVMDDGTHAKGWKTLSARGWNRDEPGYPAKPEPPVLFQRSAKLLPEIGTTLQDVLRDAGLPEHDVRIIMGPGRDDQRPRVRI
jgi:Zn-dependent peptidase ImmA (M78 family)/transcriptional regulator with XRE-family HTH domain